jgi:hypothetical protein
MMCTSTGSDLGSFANRITTASVTHRVLGETQIEDDSDRLSRISGDDDDPLSDYQREHNNDTSKQNESLHDNDERTAPRRMSLEEIAKCQQKMIEFFFQHYTKLLGKRRSSTSDTNNKFQIAQLKL